MAVIVYMLVQVTTRQSTPAQQRCKHIRFTHQNQNQSGPSLGALAGGGGPRGHHHVNAESDLNGEIVIVLLLNRFIARNQAMGQLSRYIVFLLTAFCQILAAMLDIARCKSRSG